MPDTSLAVSQNLLTAVNSPNNNNFGQNITALTTSLSGLNTTLAGNDKYTDALNQNTLANNIISSEMARIQSQQSILDNAQKGQQRILNLNDSYRKRYTQYLKMIIAVAIILVIVWVLQVLDTRFAGLIPSYLFDLLTVIIVSIGVIYCYLVYSDIGRHNPLNYDELNIATPENAAPPQTAGAAAPNSNESTNGGDLTASGACSGQSCCGTGTIWDPITKTCKQSTQGFTTLSQSMSNVEPKTPFEYSSYAPLY